MTEQPSRAPALDPESLARLAGGLAHELKNPLSTISLHLALLREEFQDEDEPRARRAVRQLNVLRDEVRRLDEILEDFLRFARTDSMDLETVSVNDLLTSLVQFVTPQTNEEGIELQTLLDVDLPPVRLDPGRMRQALLNLVINARQALGEQGGQITLISRRSEDEAVIEIVDDGPGMSPEILERCFEPYFSSKKGGSGLGLTTVRRLVEAHGGRLEMESSPGHGTRVRICLPLQETSSTPLEPRD